MLGTSINSAWVEPKMLRKKGQEMRLETEADCESKWVRADMM